MKIKNMVMISLSTAMMCILTVIVPPIPISPLNISVTIQTLIIMITGIILRPMDAFISLVLYIFLGIIGLPVFSNFQSGPSAIVGPTGGFIIAFPFAAFFISILKGNKSVFRLTIVNFVFGVIFIYIFGMISLSLYLEQSYFKVAAGMIIFIVPDIIKVVFATAIGYKLRNFKLYNGKGLF